MSQPEFQDDSISISDIIDFFRSLSGWFVAAFLIAGLVAGLVACQKVLSHANGAVHSLNVEFTFDSANEGKYPDGTNFSPEHLLSQPSLQFAVEANNLKQFGISAAALRDMISISREGSAAKRNLKNFTDELARLKKDKAPFEAVQAFTDSYNAANSQLAVGNESANTFLTRTLVLTDTDGLLPIPVAKKILTDLPKFWSDFYLEEIGVDSNRLFNFSGGIISTEALDQVDYPLMVDMLEDRVVELKTYVNSFAALEGGVGLKDPVTGDFISDLAAKLDILERFDLREQVGALANIGLARNRAVTPVLYRDRLLQLKFERERLLEDQNNHIALIERSIEQNGPRFAQYGSNYQGNGVPNSVQLTSDFLDKIILLTNTAKESSFLVELKNDLLEIRRRIAENGKAEKRIQMRLDAILTQDAFPTVTGLSREEAEQKMVEIAQTIITRLNTISDSAFRIGEIAEANFADYSAPLYRLHSDQKRPQKIDPLISTRTFILVFAGFFLTFILIVMFGVLSLIGRKTRAN